MKTIQTLGMMFTGAMLAAAVLRAEEPVNEPAKEPAKEMKCAPKKEGDAKPAQTDKTQDMKAKMKAMEDKEKADAAELDKLFDVMNSSVGERKIEAMAAILNKMAQKEKAMKAKCEAMMKGGMEKKDAAAGAVDYYTCKMHPEVRWPMPGKCPICSMELVSIAKKTADAKPEEGAKKAEDPHAAHH